MHSPKPLIQPPQKRNFYLKTFLYLLEKNNFSCPKKKIFILSGKNFLHLQEKNKIFQTNSFSKQLLIITVKTIFQTKNFLQLPEKLISYTFAKCLSDSFQVCFEYGSVILYFSKLKKVLTKKLSHFLFVKELFFHTF